MRMARRAVLAAGVLLGALCSAPGAALGTTIGAASDAATPGPAFALGGSVRAQNTEIWERLVQLAGGRGSRIAILSMASGNPERAAALARPALEQAGAVVEFVAVAPGLNGQDVLQEVRNPRWIEMIGRAQGVFFTGGAQAARRCGVRSRTGFRRARDLH